MSASPDRVEWMVDLVRNGEIPVFVRRAHDFEPADLADVDARTLVPGVYTNPTSLSLTGPLTLDAQGDPTAVFVFQSGSTLITASDSTITLIGGAQACNVFWQVGSAGRIEDGSSMVGTIIAPAGVTISTAGQTAQTTLIGRALGLTASVTMVNTTIVAP